MVRMELGEVEAQTAAIKGLAEEVKQATSAVKKAASGVALAPGLNGEAFQSIGRYLGQAYPALGRALEMYAEDLVSANERYVAGYKKQCGGKSLDSDELVQQIQQTEYLIQGYECQKQSIADFQKNQPPELAVFTQVVTAAQQVVFTSSIQRNQQKKAQLQKKLDKLLAFDAYSPSYFSQVEASYNLVRQGLQALGMNDKGEITTSSWNGHGFSGYHTEWIEVTNQQWEKRETKLKLEQEQVRAKKFAEGMEGKTYQRVVFGAGAEQWMWVKNPQKVTPEELRFNEEYKDYLALLSQPKESSSSMEEIMAEELRTGINHRTGEPLNKIETVQRWASIVSMLALVVVGGYYGVKTAKKLNSSEISVPKKASGAKNLKNPDIGNKLDYLFGKAKGSKHNIQRSQTMQSELSKVGIYDTPSSRELLNNHLKDVVNDSSNIVKTESRSYIAKELPDAPTVNYTATVKESFLKGPNGGVKIESVWDGDRLLTIIVKGGK